MQRFRDESRPLGEGEIALCLWISLCETLAGQRVLNRYMESKKTHRNYRIEMEKIASDALESKKRPAVLLHVCCAPCFSGCFECLLPWAGVTAFFYNPNMDSLEEYEKRASELRRFIKEAGLSMQVIIEDYDPASFFKAVKGYEGCAEGGERCELCYELRLRKTAEYAVKYGFDFFTTTLTLSPLKSAEKLNRIGERLAIEYGVRHLPSDFKKRDGYKRSIELSKEYGLYRQNYCGCGFSKGLKGI